MQHQPVWTSTYIAVDSTSETTPSLSTSPQSSSDNTNSPSPMINQLTLSSLGVRSNAHLPSGDDGHNRFADPVATPFFSPASPRPFPAIPVYRPTSSSFSNTANADRFYSGSAAWGHANRRHMVSFPTTGSEQEKANFNSAFPNSKEDLCDFTRPAISMLDRFAGLGDATWRAEANGNFGSFKPDNMDAVKGVNNGNNINNANSMNNMPSVPNMHNMPTINNMNNMNNMNNLNNLNNLSNMNSLNNLNNLKNMNNMNNITAFNPNINSISGGYTSPNSAFYNIETPQSSFSSSSDTNPTKSQCRQKTPPFDSDESRKPNSPFKYKPEKHHFVSTSPNQDRRAETRRKRAPQSQPQGTQLPHAPLASSVEMLRFVDLDTFSLSDVLSNCHEVCTDQFGSRLVQEKLNGCSAAILSSFLDAVLSCAYDLSEDVFGNYIVQVLFERCDQEQRKRLASVFFGRVMHLSLRPYGCRVIQSAIAHLDDDTRLQIINELRGEVMQCVQDHSGNHVIQQALQYISPERIGFIYDEICPKLFDLSTHMYGCRVVQRMLEHGNSEIRQTVIDTVQGNLEVLVLNQYGNYVVQHIVENGSFGERDFIITRLIPRTVSLSSHKYASNVMEKCFFKSTSDQRSQMVDVIVNYNRDDPEATVLLMMKDQYANYVIQQILAVSTDEDYNKLAPYVKRNLGLVRKKGYSWKHSQAIERCLK
ncbi:mRNA-binding protein [Starmerella bacillaris]|uniref:mRNA-binding protein n=1 Tax=Starmerella bacillaris TaxID=1247836 RepID=A0AAV5RGR8_STABA|nr:mRNA-binding protein [Starmerella bacillaris]